MARPYPESGQPFQRRECRTRDTSDTSGAPMMRHLAAVAVVLLVLPAALPAQQSDDEWLENCRDGRWGDWGQRARHCEIRETGMKATKQTLRVDPGMNGGVEILGWDRDSIAVTARIHVSAQNGPLTVELQGARWDGVGLDAETQNGPADLWIPGDYNAKVEFGTVNGPMDVGFPMTVTISGRVKNRISTTMGNGGPLIRVVTTNGPMSVRRSR